MLRRASSTQAPVALCSRVGTGKCLGCPVCIRTGQRGSGNADSRRGW